jgi:hypothetical protein
MAKKRVVGIVLFIAATFFTAALITGNVSIPSVMEIYDCKEMFSRYNVDADLARQAVPTDFKLKTNQKGEALMLVMVQECQKMVLDHIINVGPVGMSHIWIELEGPEEYIDPLPGTTGSLPTRYWHILPHQPAGKIPVWFRRGGRSVCDGDLPWWGSAELKIWRGDRDAVSRERIQLDRIHPVIS